VPEVSPTSVAAFRQRRHALTTRLTGPIEEVATRTCGIHAQVMSSAELEAWARSDAAGPGAITRALWEERRLVRTWCMRGTLHLLTPEQHATYVAAVDPSVAGAWLRYFDLTQEDLDRVLAAVAESLDGEPMTRRELADAVGARLGAEWGDRLRSNWGELLKPAARRGVLVNGPNRGSEVTFVRTDRWTGAAPAMEQAEARAALVRAYLRSYGPASREDYARWLGARVMTPINKTFKAMASELAEVDVGGRRLCLLQADLDELATSPATLADLPLRLLPSFDPFVLGHADRDHLAAAELRPQIYRTAGWISPTVLSRGRLIGTWKHAQEGGRLAVRITLFDGTPSPAERDALEAEAGLLGRYFDREPGLYT
jgi:Winged helix DNA-binding domain